MTELSKQENHIRENPFMAPNAASPGIAQEGACLLTLKVSEIIYLYSQKQMKVCVYTNHSTDSSSSYHSAQTEFSNSPYIRNNHNFYTTSTLYSLCLDDLLPGFWNGHD